MVIGPFKQITIVTRYLLILGAIYVNQWQVTLGSVHEFKVIDSKEVKIP
jgi:hypothetical protein